MVRMNACPHTVGYSAVAAALVTVPGAGRSPVRRTMIEKEAVDQGHHGQSPRQSEDVDNGWMRSIHWFALRVVFWFTLAVLCGIVAGLIAGYLFYAHAPWAVVASVLVFLTGVLVAGLVDHRSVHGSDASELWSAAAITSQLILIAMVAIATGPLYHRWFGQPITAVVTSQGTSDYASWEEQNVRMADPATGVDIGDIDYAGDTVLRPGDRVAVSVDPTGWLRPRAIYPRPVARALHIAGFGAAAVVGFAGVVMRLRRYSKGLWM
jgi:hypothetical protein